MTPTTEQLESMLGELEPLYAERILETHATIDEIAEALANLEDEERSGERRETASPGAAAVRAILEEMLDGERREDELRDAS